MGFFDRFRKNEKGVTSLEVAFAAPMISMMALCCVEFTSYVLFQQKMDRAVTTMADLTSQARGLAANDLNSIYDAAQYIMKPFDMGASGNSIIVSSISPDDNDDPHINWQWNSSSVTSKFGSVNATATLPTGFVVRDGESVIVTEIFAKYVPVILVDVISTDPVYQYSVFRPRFDALTALD